MGVKVTFMKQAAAQAEGADRPTTLVPKAAIRTENNQSYAFVVAAGGVIDRRAVRIAGTDGDRVEVVAGLASGERVVLTPAATLATGTMVSIKGEAGR